MKRIGGVPCRRVKTAMGRKYWVRMTEDEILERDIFRLALIAVPTIMIWLFAWAGGML